MSWAEILAIAALVVSLVSAAFAGATAYFNLRRDRRESAANEPQIDVVLTRVPDEPDIFKVETAIRNARTHSIRVREHAIIQPHTAYFVDTPPITNRDHLRLRAVRTITLDLPIEPEGTQKWTYYIDVANAQRPITVEMNYSVALLKGSEKLRRYLIKRIVGY